MESDEIRQALREADRAEAAPWIDYPPTPRWYPVAVGLWAALITLALTTLGQQLRVPAVLALIAIEIGFIRWYVRFRHGVMPIGPAPREFRRSVALFVVGAALVLAMAYGLTALVSHWVAGGAVLVVVPVLLTWYERAYADAARRARERLG